VIPVALIHHWLLLHWPSVAGPGVGVIGILIAIVAHRRAARAVAECTALINGSVGSRGTVDPRALRDLAVVRYDALSEMSGQLSFSVALQCFVVVGVASSGQAALDDIDGAPVCDRRHGHLRERRERGFVVERTVE